MWRFDSFIQFYKKLFSSIHVLCISTIILLLNDHSIISVCGARALLPFFLRAYYAYFSEWSWTLLNYGHSGVRMPPLFKAKREKSYYVF